MRAHSVVMAVTEDMPVFEAAVPCQVFGVDRPHLADPWYSFTVVPVGNRPVRLSPGFTVAPVSGGWDLGTTDTLVVPACTNVHDAPPAELVAVVREAYERGIRILSICSGAFILAAAGVLDGRRATTHWLHADELSRRYPAVRVDPSVLYVEDANVITSAGTVAGIDACLHVVRIDHGAAVAAELARRLVTPPHRDGGQAQYRPAAPVVRDDWLAPLLDWADEHLHLPLTTADLAARANVSVRTVERRFAEALGMSPLRWLLQQRVRRAQQLLETSDRPVSWIADTCGFGGAAGLRAHFARIVGMSPTTYRRTFVLDRQPEVDATRVVNLQLTDDGRTPPRRTHRRSGEAAPGRRPVEAAH
ncbi:GlxA family transcriptional regulator [Kibdelosporangium persicum]|uniref:Transcriptional regulator containing an amidase domain and an AraC-type DNA-binding HTH domain n=1 Tax=Kibdelosporangium persicum TaxID=2698649 RepID=A0ABX2EXL3_9PSEU|nr:helix-turn-helix domain-containing protein [Kibdelosporangium persicum]NRN63496.1 Transcriptional regulator containing an amidase domain and an AraC-type DNA-binding HTH domain [Kibdelosporangium persicum]